MKAEAHLKSLLFDYAMQSPFNWVHDQRGNRYSLLKIQGDYAKCIDWEKYKDRDGISKILLHFGLDSIPFFTYRNQCLINQSLAGSAAMFTVEVNEHLDRVKEDGMTLETFLSFFNTKVFPILDGQMTDEWFESIIQNPRNCQVRHDFLLEDWASFKAGEARDRQAVLKRRREQIRKETQPLTDALAKKGIKSIRIGIDD